MMTKLRKIILIPALSIVFISGFFSCGVDRWPEYAHQTALDTWMLDIMQQNYLWYQDLPSYDDVNLFLDPASFLSKVKSKSDSYSFVDSVMETPLPTYGFDYSLVRSADIDTAYNALITYVIPGSPAEAAGLVRGDWIMKVDTSYISKKYETQLLQGTKARDLVMGVWKEVPVEPEEGEVGEEETTVYKVVPNDKTLKLPAARAVEDNPVHKTEILTVKENNSDIKVGYLMYNSFTAGTKADPEKYNDELRQISQEFKKAGVKYVILDLRYNAGGSLDCVQLLGTILTSNARLNGPMAYLEYNDKNRNKDATINFDPTILGSGTNLDLPGLFVITSGTTAGAPEMLIGSLFLKDSYPVVSIGSATKGQNVATEQFVNEEFLWSVNPVVCTVYNSKHDENGSFVPNADLKISETTIDGITNYSEFLPFGDPNERLLKVAIGVIEGTYPPKKEEDTTTKAQFKIEKSVISPASRRFVGGGGLKIK
ncbi:Carboxyl-terminal protease [Bacteroides ovatus]|uniref:S41 family peptidase n=1 Tax=Bacteroides TaxID=816 RepID=UPI000E8F0B95|nr:MULTISPECIES: S41 family peptidase [Bacteroides]MCS3177538.1 S41 family peptidase [Candidatus Bacteroides intestinigallinarum]RGN55125.1 peptidase S41 [Bacteroides sp. OM05-10AA]RGQ59556.1 peptidase S41 [Bacteroides sp. AF27-33]CAG9889206.1 Carboxyl-terminal protease [Bacteroides ovatus]